MASIVIMPKQGLMMEEGTITSWLKQEGDEVVAGQPLFEMETDKLTITMNAEVSGTLLKILHPAGDTVPTPSPSPLSAHRGRISPPCRALPFLPPLLLRLHLMPPQLPPLLQSCPPLLPWSSCPNRA